jgi:hypothetical protein
MRYSFPEYAPIELNAELQQKALKKLYPKSFITRIKDYMRINHKEIFSINFILAMFPLAIFACILIINFILLIVKYKQHIIDFFK